MRDDSIDDSQMPLIEHLTELRTRLIYALIAFGVSMMICFVYASDIYQFLARPLTDVLIAHGLKPELIITSLLEAFTAHLSVAFYFGLFFGFPLIANQMWRFVAPGLYAEEKGAFLPFLIASPVLFFAGGALVYYVVSPLAFDFFVSWALSSSAEAADAAGEGGGAEIKVLPKVSEYLDLVMKFILAFGLAFQLPVLLTLLGRAGLVSSEDLANGRKYAVVAILIFAAIITPPDVYSQIFLGVPLYLLYEISIFLTGMFEKKREERLRAEGYYDDE